MKTLEDICKYIGSIIDKNPVCVETGCVYSVLDDTNKCDGTTNNIAEFVCSPNDGVLYSLDTNENNLSHSAKLVNNCARNVPFYPMVGDSVDSLKILAGRGIKVDLLCLDSEEWNPPHGLNEYLAISNNLKERHFILQDDVLNEPSTKWRLVVPHLISLGYDTRIVPTPVGMLVASKGYKLW